MRDGRTRRVESEGGGAGFLERHHVSLTLLNGPAAGTEFALQAPRVMIGRSASACIALDDPSVSSEHASIELGPDGFGVRDLASTNGVQVNGAAVTASALKHGDRLTIGSCELQYVVETREAGRTWQLDGA